MYESKVEMPGQGHQAHLGKLLHFHLILPNIKNDFLSEGSLKHCLNCKIFTLPSYLKIDILTLIFQKKVYCVNVIIQIIFRRYKSIKN